MNSVDTKPTRKPHGMGKTRVYWAWAEMRRSVRQANASSGSGATAVTIAGEWNCFENFFADMGHPPEKHLLDRIDKHKGYSRENCRWASRREKINSRKNTVMITHQGITKPLSYWADELGIPFEVLRRRHSREVIGEKLFDTPEARPAARFQSGIAGIVWCDHAGMWKARISSGGRRIHIGIFKTIPEAEEAMNAFRQDL